ncbi:hypothetical protein BaRGS_00003601 [Batillaria attramentaria]|uniref:BTB domain-containing protein n=1 Tax=Batillaria attramentaria TaxID=370345 RepID=A0ABD0M018_9CAEN
MALFAGPQQKGPFETADDTTDVVFVVEGRKLYFNKMILGMCSPVFKTMFTSNFKEKEAEEVPLPDKKYRSMVAFLEQLHPVHSSTPITDITLAQILPLADEYQVEPLRQRCEQYIRTQVEMAGLGKALTEDQLLMYFWLCEEYRLPEHREQLVELGAKKRATELTQRRFYELLPPAAKSDLMTTRAEALEAFLYDTVADAFRRLSDVKEKMPEQCTNGYRTVECSRSDGRKLYFNKGILVVCSPVFKSMLFTLDANEIPLAGRNYKDVQAFLEQLHPVYSHQEPVTETTFTQILPLADEYQAKHVLEKCDQFIVTQTKKASSLTTDQVLLYLWLCETHLKKHRDTFLHLAAQRKSWELKKSRNYKLLPETTMLEVMTMRCVKLDDFMYGHLHYRCRGRKNDVCGMQTAEKLDNALEKHFKKRHSELFDLL